VGALCPGAVENPARAGNCVLPGIDVGVHAEGSTIPPPSRWPRRPLRARPRPRETAYRRYLNPFVIAEW